MSEIRERFVEVNEATAVVAFPKDRAVLKLVGCHNFNGESVTVVVPDPTIAAELILRLVGFITIAAEDADTNGS